MMRKRRLLHHPLPLEVRTSSNMAHFLKLVPTIFYRVSREDANGTFLPLTLLNFLPSHPNTAETNNLSCSPSKFSPSSHSESVRHLSKCTVLEIIDTTSGSFLFPALTLNEVARQTWTSMLFNHVVSFARVTFIHSRLNNTSSPSIYSINHVFFNI